nr:hypothetical protein [uncultured Porphyromonas sp.]
MYRKLVAEIGGLLGMIAYALYKQEKNKEISGELEKKRQAKHKRADKLTDKELRSCCERFKNETYIAGLIEKARKKRAEFLRIAFEEQIEEYTDEVSKLEERIRSLEQECEDLEKLNERVENAISLALKKKRNWSRWIMDSSYEALVSFGGAIILIALAAFLMFISAPIRSEAADTLDKLEQTIRPSSDSTNVEKTVKNP